MNIILVDQTMDGYAVAYIVGLRVKFAHEVIGAKNEAGLAEVLRGEGVPETAIAQALERLRQNQRSTTIDFKPKP